MTILFEGQLTQKRIQRNDLARIAPPNEDELEQSAKRAGKLHGMALGFCWAAYIVLFLFTNAMVSNFFSILIPAFFILFFAQASFIFSKMFSLHKRLAKPLWFLEKWWQRTRGKPIATIDEERWMLIERFVPCRLWIETDAEGNETLHWELNYNKAVILSEEIRPKPDYEPTPWAKEQERNNLPLTDGGFALGLVRDPLETGGTRFGLEVRSLKTRTRLTLPIDLPKGIDPAQVPLIERTMVELPPEHTSKIVDALLGRAAALNISMTPLVERMAQQRAVVLESVAVPEYK